MKNYFHLFRCTYASLQEGMSIHQPIGSSLLVHLHFFLWQKWVKAVEMYGKQNPNDSFSFPLDIDTFWIFFFSIFIYKFIPQNCLCLFLFFNFPRFIFPSITHYLPLQVFVFQLSFCNVSFWFIFSKLFLSSFLIFIGKAHL